MKTKNNMRKPRGKTKRYSVNYKEIIKQYEKSAGFRICYWCGEKIEIDNRIIFSKEFPSGEVCPSHRLKVIGAVCSNCFQKYTKLMWDSLEVKK